MVRRVHGDGAGTAGGDAAAQGGAEPYPGFSQGLPYEPTTEKDMFWAPESVSRSSRAAEVGIQKCGIGVTLVFDAALKTLVVEELAPGGPAARSGLLQRGDIVAEVDGINVTGQPLDIVESLLHGVSGSVTRLVLMRGEEPTPEALMRGGQAAVEVREIALTLAREPGFAARDVITPKRTGVGITFEADAIDNAARIKSLLRGSPADQSGLLKPGDILFEVDGTNVYREGLDVVAMLILGEPGSPVRLLFLRGTRIFVEAILHRQHSTRQSDMEDVLRYVQSVRPLMKTSDSSSESGNGVKRDIRMPASFRERA